MVILIAIGMAIFATHVGNAWFVSIVHLNSNSDVMCLTNICYNLNRRDTEYEEDSEQLQQR